MVRGAHPIYDCFACQRLSFRAIDVNEQEKAVQTRWETVLEGQVRGADYVLKQLNANTIHTKVRVSSMKCSWIYSHDC